tara:strand:- start:105 stop:704 length:600 start_codon:yes stop_codon:yes gene_type:complete
MKINGLYLIMTDPVVGYSKLAKIAVDSRVSAIQLRMKDAPKNKILDVAIKLRKITNQSSTLFIVNDYLDIAISADADGIHLGQNDVSIREARSKWNNSDKIIGLSTHNLQQAQQADEQGVDYIGIGPVFHTSSKINADPILGIKYAKKIVGSCSCSSVVIGGITSYNLRQIHEIGANGFCVLSAINSSNLPLIEIKKFQ